jgi:hypothetical protein
MLLVIIAAMAIALVVQDRRAAIREEGLKAQLSAQTHRNYLHALNAAPEGPTRQTK